MTTYWMTKSSLDTRINRDHVADVDLTPTMFYYGTVTLTIELEANQVEDFGLWFYDDASADDEAEASALYRSEMRHAA